MKVIKVLSEEDGKLVSTFAGGEWQKEYAEGAKTTPDTGYLFAYSSRNLNLARRDMGTGSFQFWLAEAEVVGRVCDSNIDVLNHNWRRFWKGFKLRLRVKRAEYLLCSSIVLVKKLAQH